MIKRLRKERKENELATTDINTTSNMKGASRDVVEDTLNEFKRGAISTHFRVAKKLAGPRIASQSKLGLQRNKPDRYRLEEKKQSSNTNSTFINTKPEQDSAMVGTQ